MKREETGGRLPAILTGARIRVFAQLLGIGVGLSAAAIASALLVRFAFDHLLVARPARPDTLLLVGVGAGLAAAAAGSAWLRAVERVAAERLGQAYVHEVRLRLFDRVIATAPRALQQRSTGGQVMRLVGDINALRQWVSLGLARVTVALTTTVASLAVLTLIDRLLAAVVATAVGLGVVAALVQGHGIRASTRDVRRRRGRLSANVNEKVATAAVVQAFGQGRREHARVAQQSRRLQRAMIERARHLGRLQGVTEATTAAGTALVLIVGAATGVRAGTVAAATLLVGLLSPQLRDLGRAEEFWHNFVIASGKIREVLARPTAVPEVRDALTLQPGPGRLEFAGVSVEGSLEALSAIAEPGQIIAVVGPNGSGKTTLLSLAARLLDPYRGRVLLDGQDLSRYSLTSVRRAVGLAGPDLPLLRGTVEHNLRYRWPEAPDEELVRVVALCGLEPLIAALPQGAETRVAERGAGLSAGERQRIALARALVGSPPVLLLDEADANLDTQAAEVVDRVVRDHGGTILLVTHRADLLLAADVIWYLEDGRLIETGTPAQLLDSDGPVSRLFRSWVVEAAP